MQEVHGLFPGSKDPGPIEATSGAFAPLGDVVFPGSKDPGPIEAARGRPRVSARRYFRGRKTPAPLKLQVCKFVPRGGFRISGVERPRPH